MMTEVVENNLLNSLSSVVQNYSTQENIQTVLVDQVKNELSESFASEIKNTVNNFGLTELKTSIENVLNKSESSNNSELISYLNNLLETNISQYTSKSANVLNETRYANSVKNLVNIFKHLLSYCF